MRKKKKTETSKAKQYWDILFMRENIILYSNYKLWSGQFNTSTINLHWTPVHEAHREREGNRKPKSPSQAWSLPSVSTKSRSLNDSGIPVSFVNVTHINRHFCPGQGRKGPRSDTTATASSQSGRGRGEWRTKEEEGLLMLQAHLVAQGQADTRYMGWLAHGGRAQNSSSQVCLHLNLSSAAIQACSWACHLMPLRLSFPVCEMVEHPWNKWLSHGDLDGWLPMVKDWKLLDWKRQSSFMPTVCHLCTIIIQDDGNNVWHCSASEACSLHKIPSGDTMGTQMQSLCFQQHGELLTQHMIPKNWIPRGATDLSLGPTPQLRQCSRALSGGLPQPPSPPASVTLWKPRISVSFPLSSSLWASVFS